MLIVALVLAVIGLAALVTAVVTSNELIAWVCIGASVIGVLLLIVDALRDRSRGGAEEPSDRDDRDGETAVIAGATDSDLDTAEDYPDEPAESSAPHLSPHEQAVDPANDDVPPSVPSDRS